MEHPSIIYKKDILLSIMIVPHLVSGIERILFLKETKQTKTTKTGWNFQVFNPLMKRSLLRNDQMIRLPL